MCKPRISEPSCLMFVWHCCKYHRPSVGLCIIIIIKRIDYCNRINCVHSRYLIIASRVFLSSFRCILYLHCSTINSMLRINHYSTRDFNTSSFNFAQNLGLQQILCLHLRPLSLGALPCWSSGR